MTSLTLIISIALVFNYPSPPPSRIFGVFFFRLSFKLFYVYLWAKKVPIRTATDSQQGVNVGGSEGLGVCILSARFPTFNDISETGPHHSFPSATSLPRCLCAPGLSSLSSVFWPVCPTPTKNFLSVCLLSRTLLTFATFLPAFPLWNLISLVLFLTLTLARQTERSLNPLDLSCVSIW